MAFRLTRIGAAVTWACLAVTLADAGAPSPIGQATPPSTAPEVRSLFEAVNASRRERRLRPLTVDSRLTAAAATQARYLARTGRLDHRGPDGSNVGQRVRRAGYQWTRVAENLAATGSSSARVVQLWMDSRPHRRNMLDPAVTQMGGAHVGTVWVLVLARPRAVVRLLIPDSCFLFPDS